MVAVAGLLFTWRCAWCIAGAEPGSYDRAERHMPRALRLAATVHLAARLLPRIVRG